MSNKPLDLAAEYTKRMKPLLGEAPWVLRVSEHQGKPVPVVIVKERTVTNRPSEGDEQNGTKRRHLHDVGIIYGSSLRRCLPVIRSIVHRVKDPLGVPLELQRFFPNGRIEFRGNLPLDTEAGPKLALIFKLQERVINLDRVELIARRVERFSREEAQYWLTRITQFSPEANRWAQAGMRIMLGGQPGDKAIPRMLERLQE